MNLRDNELNTSKSYCVFCGSSEGNDPEMLQIAYRLGTVLAKRKIKVVYGAAKIGLMGGIADGALASNGEVIGIIPDFLKLKEVVHVGLTGLITTENMHERKLKMQELSDGFITLPGGFGTLEELFEIVTWSQLGLHNKPIGLLNINGFYDDLLELLKKMVSSGFLKKENYDLVLVDKTIDGLLAKMEHFKPKAVPKWLEPDQT